MFPCIGFLGHVMLTVNERIAAKEDKYTLCNFKVVLLLILPDILHI